VTTNEAPGGMPYGERQAAEASMDAVPMSGSPGAPIVPQAAPQRDPAAVTAAYQPPTDLMQADPEALAAATAGLPLPQRPPGVLPPANREAMSLIPMMPTFERIARMPSTSPAFRRWFATVRAQLPPEVSARDL
jgi:hypothetical protein